MEETSMQSFWVARNADRFGEHFGLGIGGVSFKVATNDAHGELLVVELTHHQKGGPGRHFHYEQEEWFYVVEGEYLFEAGEERYRFGPGDSLLVPRRVPHVWAYAGSAPGRLLITFTPAGPMEGFFRESSKANAMPPQDPNFFRTYGMELLGPPLAVE
jgi:mannose-6-phosphate isomerase-like protein (cupin superfamily)